MKWKSIITDKPELKKEVLVRYVNVFNDIVHEMAIYNGSAFEAYNLYYEEMNYITGVCHWFDVDDILI